MSRVFREGRTRLLAGGAAALVVLAFLLSVPHPRSVPDPTGRTYGRKDYELLMRFIGRDVVQATVMGFHYLRHAVRLGPARMREARRWSVLVDKSDGQMTVTRGGNTWRTYRCGTGKSPGNRRKDGDGRTPVGSFAIIDKRYRPIGIDQSRPPTWQVHFSTIWYPNVIVHQTSNAAQLRETCRVSEGCVNLFRRDMKELYDSVPVGARFVIRE